MLSSIYISTTLPCLHLRSRLSALSIRYISSSKQQEIENCYGKLDLKFENTKVAFQSKSMLDLIRGWSVLKLCSYDKLVKNNAALLRTARRTLGGPLFRTVMRAGFYGHFVAGETVEEVLPKMKRMKQAGVKAILDYSVENDMSEDQAEEITKQSLTDHKEFYDIKTENNHLHGQHESPLADLVSPAVSMSDFPFPHSRLGPEKVFMEQYQAQEQFLDRRAGVISARTYFYSGEPECDRNCDIFLRCIDEVAKATNGAGFAAIKLTALGRPQFLLQLSEVIAQTRLFYKALTGSTWANLVYAQLSREDFLKKLEEFGIKTDNYAVMDWFSQVDFDHTGFVDLYEWGRLLDQDLQLSRMFKVLNLKTGQMENLISHFSKEEEQQLANMMNRLIRLADHAKNTGVRLMVDAEQTYFQPAISRLTLELMRRYNRDSAIVFNTYQCYLQRALDNARIDMHLAQREDFSFGAKLVRGAYMDQERQRAASLGYPDPVQPNYEATSEMYDSLVGEVVKQARKCPLGKVSVMCATHNENSIRNVVKLMREQGIAPSDKVLCFAQLYGMCDHISFSLGQAGYSVYKYVPYGPVEEVLPYLSRRAQENSDKVLSKSSKERNLLAKEVRRRLVGF